jgi:alpha-amylase/alpha-mannosidase (GH57 family)
MTTQPLYVAILWHMHQPYYKDLLTGRYQMPWVRLHGTKDYLDMALLLEEFPQMRVTFNLVPCLVEQIEDYAHNNARDALLDLSEKPADALTEEEKKAILESMFQAHYETMVQPFPRYAELCSKCCWARGTEELRWLAQSFTEQDFRDVQVLFNLTWIDPLLRSKDAFLTALVEKGRGFTEEEKRGVLAKQREILQRIVPTYRTLQERGQIELTTSPYFHPILPLLIDTEIARQADPHSLVPTTPFRHPEDAEAQVRLAVEHHERWFGKRPRGMWSSEGSVSQALIPLLAQHGIQWIATDEQILAQSDSVGPIKRDIGGNLSPDAATKLFQAYRVQHDGSALYVFFRDHFLSDLIGFRYSHWKGEDAARDLVERLLRIRRELPDPVSAGSPTDQPYIVSIILDGENCWEHYAEDGLPFLRRLYSLLSQSEELRTITFGDFCAQRDSPQGQIAPVKTLEKLHPGSWVDANFSIWIGHQEDIQSWEYLRETREDVMRAIKERGEALSAEQRARALKAIYIAEGSDWNWWYGDEQSSGQDEEFDALYREHLRNAYRALGLEPAPHLDVPIVSVGEIGTILEPHGFIQPVIEGKITNYYEWFAAGVYKSSSSGGTMRAGQSFVRAFYYGFDLEQFYLRIDPPVPLQPPPEERLLFSILLLNKNVWKIEIPLQPNAPPSAAGLRASCYTHQPEGEWRLRFESDRVAFGNVLEMALPLKDLELSAHDSFWLQIIVELDGKELERAPVRNPLHITVPDKDFEKEFWIV